MFKQSHGMGIFSIISFVLNHTKGELLTKGSALRRVRANTKRYASLNSLVMKERNSR